MGHQGDDDHDIGDEYEYEDDDDELSEDDEDEDTHDTGDAFAAALIDTGLSSSGPRVQVFDEDTIVAELKAQANQASVLLNVSMSAACKIMREFDWDYDKLQDNYFEDPEILTRLGLHLGQQVFPLHLFPPRRAIIVHTKVLYSTLGGCVVDPVI